MGIIHPLRAAAALLVGLAACSDSNNAPPFRHFQVTGPDNLPISKFGKFAEPVEEFLGAAAGDRVFVVGRYGLSPSITFLGVFRATQFDVVKRIPTDVELIVADSNGGVLVLDRAPAVSRWDASGSLIWRKRLVAASPWNMDTASVRASNVAGDHFAVIVGDRLIAMDLDGAVRWAHQLDASMSLRQAVADESGIFAFAIRGGDELVVLRVDWDGTMVSSRGSQFVVDPSYASFGTPHVRADGTIMLPVKLWSTAGTVLIAPDLTIADYWSYQAAGSAAYLLQRYGQFEGIGGPRFLADDTVTDQRSFNTRIESPGLAHAFFVYATDAAGRPDLTRSAAALGPFTRLSDGSVVSMTRNLIDIGELGAPCSHADVHLESVMRTQDSAPPLAPLTNAGVTSSPAAIEAVDALWATTDIGGLQVTPRDVDCHPLNENGP